jgi:hypothetical protein
MRTGVFIREVLDPYRVHIAQFWDADTIDNIEKTAQIAGIAIQLQSDDQEHS